MIRAGDECRKTGDFRCDSCGTLVHVEAGLSIPPCPECGGSSFVGRDRPPHGE